MKDLGFDLDRYLRNSKRVDLTDLDWVRIREYPVTIEEARCLSYMMDIESHTVIFLRDLLSTPAALEPDITAFLSCWVYEELWHGEAFSRFLGEAGYALEPDGERTRWDDPYPSRVKRNFWIRGMITTKVYVEQLKRMAGWLMVKDFPAVHMTWGALNEYSTLTAYHRLIAKTNHPVMIEMLHRVIKDERRHYAFYRNQAQLRLARSAKARKVTRWALEQLWAPVGTGVRPIAETDFVISYLMGDEEGLATAREMDESISELPGLERGNYIEKSVHAALDRLGNRQSVGGRRESGVGSRKSVTTPDPSPQTRRSTLSEIT
ncbi:MAG: ferritin-like domain-containing protein [Gemmatimonadaceae bacterium]